MLRLAVQLPWSSVRTKADIGALVNPLVDAVRIRIASPEAAPRGVLTTPVTVSGDPGVSVGPVVSS